jgi:hypothetical protein
VLLSVEYLHYMSYKLLLPLYVVSSTSCPCEFFSVSDGSDDVRFVVFRSFVLWEYVFGNSGGVFYCLFIVL